MTVLLLFQFLFFLSLFAGVQPRQDPGVPSGWTALARERESERERETRLGVCSRVWQIFFTLAFLFYVSTFLGEDSLILHQLVLHKTRVFSAYFFVRVLYIIFWPWGLLTFCDLGESKAVFHNLFLKEHKGQSFCRSYQLNLSKRFTTQRLCSSGEAAHSRLKWTTLNSYFSKFLTITTFRINFYVL